MTQPIPLAVDHHSALTFRPLRWWLRVTVLIASVVVAGFGVGVMSAAGYDATGGKDPALLDAVTEIGLGVGAALGLGFGALWRGVRWQARRAHKLATLPSPQSTTLEWASPPAVPMLSPGPQPSAWPTMLTTLLFSPLVGWIPALIQGRRARRNGLDEAYYWKAFAATVVVSALLVLALKILSGS